MLHKLTNACYMTIIDASLDYHNLKHNRNLHIKPFVPVNLAGTGTSGYPLE